MRLDKTTTLIFLVAVIARCFFLPFTHDDAFITYRHVANLLAGNGLVYNAGEKVLGASSPLYTLLLGLLGACSLDFVFFGKVLCVVCGALTCCVLYAILNDGQVIFATVSALLAALSANLVANSAMGLETGLSVLLCLLAILAYVREKRVLLGVMLGLAILARVDAGILALIILGHLSWRKRGVPYAALGGMAVVLVPWTIVAWAYYGTPVPHSVIAKLLVYRGTPEETSTLQILSTFVSKPDKVLLSAFAFWGTTRAFRHQGGVMVLYIWPFLHLGALLTAHGHVFNWYYSPIMPGYLSLAALGLVDMVRRTQFRLRMKTDKLLIILAAILIATSAARLWYTFQGLRHGQETLDSVHRQIGLWLGDHCPENQVVLAADIGYIGYFSRCRLLDWMGLVSPEVLPYYRKNRPEDVARDMKPDFIVLGEYDFLFKKTVHQAWFEAKYREIKRFEHDGTVYVVWAKKGNPG